MAQPKTITADKVEMIPATQRSVKSGGQFHTAGHLRVAAYARVSTEEDNQQTSYHTQCEYFTSLISSNPDWEFAGMYADEGITGTSRKNRIQFNRMMEDAEAGKFDYIITKSTSRFARNTVDSLTCVRKLMRLNPPVGVFFEEDGLDTLDGSSELLITIKSALAQEESNSISKNIRWTFQKKFQAGEPVVCLSGMLGYDKGPDGAWVINEAQAGIVRFIFSQYLAGKSGAAIAKELNKAGKTTVRGNPWYSEAVISILRNEKYVGDVEMQKTVTESFLTHKCVKNKGQAPKYYLKDHHEGIVDRDTWEMAQARLNGIQSKKQKGKEKRAGDPRKVFGNLICGECGEKYKRAGYRTVLSGYSDSRSLAAEGIDDPFQSEEYAFCYGNLRCTGKYGGQKDSQEEKSRGKECASGIVNEIAAKQSIMEMLYGLKRDYEANGEASFIAREYSVAAEVLGEKLRKTSAEARRIDQLEGRIRDLAARLESVRLKKETVLAEERAAASALGEYESSGESASQLYAQLEEDICANIAACRNELEGLSDDGNAAETMKRNYELFLHSLESLPETNRAGMKLNVNGLDVDGSLFSTADGSVRKGVLGRFNERRLKMDGAKIAKAPDFLDFNKAIYQTFFTRGVVKTKGMTIEGELVTEDCIEFYTNFGVKLTCRGTGRNLRSFLGFRRCGEDGVVELLTENWQVTGNSVLYRRRDLTRKSRKRS